MATEKRWKVVIYLGVAHNNHIDDTYLEGFMYGTSMGVVMCCATDQARSLVSMITGASLVDIEIEEESV